MLRCGALEVGKAEDGRHHIREQRLGPRLAGLLRDGLDDVIEVLVDRVPDILEQVGTTRRRDRRPLGGHLAGLGDGIRNVRR